jgi:drug/metabolite transporter (DMT)-like permease
MRGNRRTVLAVLLVVAGILLTVLAFLNPSLVITLGALAAVIMAIIAVYGAFSGRSEEASDDKG